MGFWEEVKSIASNAWNSTYNPVKYALDTGIKISSAASSFITGTLGAAEEVAEAAGTFAKGLGYTPLIIVIGVLILAGLLAFGGGKGFGVELGGV